MASNRPKDSGKKDAFGHSRKTMQFNERTDRSLHAELSQLERNRREIMRDLRKIKQIKTALNDQLQSALEFKSMNRKVSDSSVYAPKVAPSAMKLPFVDRKGNRPRFRSDVGPFEKLILNEKTRINKLSARTEGQPDHPVEHGPTQSNLLQKVQWGGIRERSDEATRDGYKTNQELREDILIKTRFNQLGSKYVGKEIFNKKHSKTPSKDSKRRLSSGLAPFTRNEMLQRNEHNKKVGFFETEVIEEVNKEDLSPSFVGLSMKEPLEQQSNIFGRNTTKTQEVTASQNSTPVNTNTAIREEKDSYVPTKLSPLSAMRGNLSFDSKRKISTSSLGSYSVDNTRMRQDAVLPTIPIEFRSSRQTNELNSLGKAFMVCRQVSAEGKDIKNERKRRFANLVDMVVKQRKVITAWEPLMRNVGDIQSDDEV